MLNKLNSLDVEYVREHFTIEQSTVVRPGYIEYDPANNLEFCRSSIVVTCINYVS